jgi:hypothetical protein
MLMVRRIVLPLLVVLSVALGPARGIEAEPREDWYVVELQGQRSGWMREYLRVTDRGYESGMEMHLSFGRGGQRATVGIETSFLESEEHEPIEMIMTQRLGQAPVTSRFVFTGDGIELTTVNAGQEFTQTMPLPEGEWLTPVQAYAFIEEQLEQGAEAITVRMVSPLAGPAPIESTMTVEKRENIEVFGRTVPALRTRVETSLAPGQESVQWTDLEGRAVKTEQAFGAMTFTVIAADKQLALAEVDPPEMMASTFVKPTGAPIRDPRGATRAEYILSATGAEIPTLSSGAQTAERLDDGRVRVTLDLSRVDDDPAGPEHLESSSMIAAGDEVITQLKARALQGVANTPADRALALRRFVHDFIDEKSLGVGFATASEVARTGAGDCSEHGVLLAALLRSANIPSRVVTGLVYTQAFAGAQDVFGYHVWTQAHLDGRWVDLDPTIAGDSAFDAAHIALAVSPMSDGSLVNSLVEIAPLLGSLEIETVSVK